jgi:hypothetical protein
MSTADINSTFLLAAAYVIRQKYHHLLAGTSEIFLVLARNQTAAARLPNFFLRTGPSPLRRHCHLFLRTGPSRHRPNPGRTAMAPCRTNCVMPDRRRPRLRPPLPLRARPLRLCHHLLFLRAMTSSSAPPRPCPPRRRPLSSTPPVLLHKGKI